MNDALDQLFEQQKLWRGSSASAKADAHIATGYPVLDKFLPGGGWPRAALTEVLLDEPGSGELQLVMPALVRLSQAGNDTNAIAISRDAGRWISWIAPPYVPYAPALAEAGINLSRMLIVQAREGLDAMWAAEQSLRCGTCAAVLVWVAKSDTRSMRRLQLAAEEGDSWGIVFRHSRTRSESSPAAVRLQLATDSHGKTLHLLKSRGGRPLKVAADFLNP